MRALLTAATLLAVLAPAADARTYGDLYWGRQPNYPSAKGWVGESTIELSPDHRRVADARIAIWVRCVGSKGRRPGVAQTEEARVVVRGGRFAFKETSYGHRATTPITWRIRGRISADGSRITGWADYRDTGYAGRCYGRQTFDVRRWAPAPWAGRTATGLPLSFDLHRPGEGRSMASQSPTTWLHNVSVAGVPLRCPDGTTRTATAAGSTYALLTPSWPLTRTQPPAVGWGGPLGGGEEGDPSDAGPLSLSGVLLAGGARGTLQVAETVQPPAVTRTEPGVDGADPRTWTETPEPMRCTSEKLAFTAAPR